MVWEGVAFNGEWSTTRNILCGVPQGSVMWLILLFLFYINDLAANISCKFTDDVLVKCCRTMIKLKTLTFSATAVKDPIKFIEVTFQQDLK